MKEKIIEILESVDRRRSIGFFIDNDKIADEIIKANYGECDNESCTSVNVSLSLVCDQCGKVNE